MKKITIIDTIFSGHGHVKIPDKKIIKTIVVTNGKEVTGIPGETNDKKIERNVSNVIYQILPDAASSTRILPPGSYIWLGLGEENSEKYTFNLLEGIYAPKGGSIVIKTYDKDITEADIILFE